MPDLVVPTRIVDGDFLSQPNRRARLPPSFSLGGSRAHRLRSVLLPS